ncbi:sulfatase [Coraliomargarita sp. SDUM461004]|uniref:Sulfatase n=1 Tax=Thalassobacterium sedimentorum TaxID=3041258 RepID=A0ABU1AFZ1_9BACT|nr:sulfatase [Coraliomargarita sp. SDUM461004]MDQ8193693.1 sulfatase [Coraliomargarita sp. SDUM461004]
MKIALIFLCLALLHLVHAKRPNIVFLLADDQRYDTLGVTGNTVFDTPKIDALADEGVLFEQSFVVSSACAPNRAAIFSGMYNRSSGVRDFSADFTPEQRDQLYPFLLQEAGYYIGFIGKWGVAATIASTMEPYRKRFDFWKGLVGQGHYYTANRQERHLTQVMADQAETFFATAPKDRPFCLSVSFKAPHGPWNQYDRRFAGELDDVVIPYPDTLNEESIAALPSFMRTFRISLNGASVDQLREVHSQFVREYYRLIIGLDEAVGRIRASLEAQGLSDNTVIIYASDNGHFLHEWGFHGKWLMYEPSIHVPLIVYDPRLPAADRGKRVDALTQSIDYAPTFLEYANVAVPEHMQGRSLKPLVEDRVPSDWREDVFHDYIFEMYPGDIPKNIGVRTDRYKLVRYTGPRPQYEQLFDLYKDPLELQNLIDDPAYREVVRDMQRRLSRYRTDLVDVAPDYQEYVNSYEVVGIGADFPDAEIDLSTVQTVGQSFIAVTDRLRHVEWRWPFFIAHYPERGVVVRLRKQGPRGDLLAEVTIPPNEIYNLNLSRAHFEVAGLTPGEILYIEFEALGILPARRAGLWRYSEDVFKPGHLYKNGEAARGDLPLSFVFHQAKP